MNTWVFFFSVFIICGTVESSIPGGWKPLSNLTSPSILENGREATALVSKSFNSPSHLKLVVIRKAESQVVSGMNYRLELVIAPTECQKSGNYTIQEIQDCPLKCEETYVCKVMLWVQPWSEEKYKLTKSDCTQGESSC